jgi:hypothetical protein
MRVRTLAFTSLRNNATSDLNFNADLSLRAAMVVIWQTIEISHAIATATIVALKRFTESLNTGFRRGELIRVHGNSQNYDFSALSASLKDSKFSKPSINVKSKQNLATRQDAEITSTNEDDIQSSDLRLENLHNEVAVSLTPKSSSSEHRGKQYLCPGNNSIRHDVRYSVHYDEDPLLPVP